jgi:hypothetical protein
MSKNELIKKTYDHILATFICQKKLVSKLILWGDGTIYNNDKEVFNAVYDIIFELIETKELTFN